MCEFCVNRLGNAGVLLSSIAYFPAGGQLFFAPRGLQCSPGCARIGKNKPERGVFKMKIEVLREEFTVCKVEDYGQVDWSQRYCFVAQTEAERSLVCPVEAAPANTTAREDGWRAFRLAGVLDFGLIGILARLAALLAERGISIFAVSTYDTDYLLVRTQRLEEALDCLRANGYTVEQL